jgi:hypothetical protein
MLRPTKERMHVGGEGNFGIGGATTCDNSRDLVVEGSGLGNGRERSEVMVWRETFDMHLT